MIMSSGNNCTQSELAMQKLQVSFYGSGEMKMSSDRVKFSQTECEACSAGVPFTNCVLSNRSLCSSEHMR